MPVAISGGFDEEARGRRTGDGLDGEVAEAADGPCVLVSLDEGASVRSILELVEEELSVGLDGVDAAGGEEAVEVIVESLDVWLGDDEHLAARRANTLLHSDVDGLVSPGELAVGRYAAPIAQKGVPDGDMLDVWMLGPDLRDGRLETVWEALLVGLEFGPASEELALPWIIERLPVVVDDEIGDVNSICPDRLESGENLLLRQLLPDTVPGAV
jgi:hypothetical protein